MHSQHPLTPTTLPGHNKSFRCKICKELFLTDRNLSFYGCSICEFYVDMECTSVVHTIKDKCHDHPLIPLMQPSSFSFFCYICEKKEEGLSYKCNFCPFGVHQNCTLMIPNTVKHNDHAHLLTLLPSWPLEYDWLFCDICHKRLHSFACMYGCLRCIFFAHVCCATSKTKESSPMPSSMHFMDPVVLPLQEKSTELVSWFANYYRNRYYDRQFVIVPDKTYFYQDTIKFFGHRHPLFLVDDHSSEVICDACVLPISTSFYGCIDCDYFIHTSCTELPKSLRPPTAYYSMYLKSDNEIFRCKCCIQWSNGFAYKFSDGYIFDIKCASLLRPRVEHLKSVKHEGHKHPLIQAFDGSACSICDNSPTLHWCLKCDTCNFILCFQCAMLPSIIKHRYDEHPFKLTYSPIEDHYYNYICDLCEGDLNPKKWFYHCDQCDHSTHTKCMRERAAVSNIKFGKLYKLEVHEHNLALVSCAYSGSFCNKCCLPMRTGYNVGLECIPCDFRIHFLCAFGRREYDSNAISDSHSDNPINP